MVEPAEESGIAKSRLALIASGAILLLAAYWKLWTYEAPQRLASEIEGWFFLASDTSPLVIFGLVAWVLFRRRDRVRRALRQPRAVLPALFFLALGLGMFGWATYIQAYDLLAMSLAANTLALGFWLGGRALARVLLLPSVMMMLAIPLPAAFVNQIVFPLQLWTANIATHLLEFIGVPALLEADQIHLRGGDFEVIETCSGLRSIETLTLVALIYIDLFVRNARRAAIVLFSAPLVAFLVNGVRVLSLILNPDSEQLAIHTLQGVAALLGGVAAIWGIDSLLMRFAPTADRPETDDSDRSWPSLGSSTWLAVTLVAGVLALGSIAIPVYELPLRSSFSIHSMLPRESRIWESTKLSVDRNFLGSVDFEHIFNREFGEGTNAVHLFVGYSKSLERHRSAVSEKTARLSSGWAIEDLAGGSQVISVPGIEAEVDRLILRYGAERILAYHWREGAVGTVEEVLRAFFGLDVSPLRRTDGIVVVRLATDIAPTVTGAAEADERLRRFLTVARRVVDAMKSSGAAR